MIIITGTGRSGTETFARMLGGYHEFRVHYILEKYFLHADPYDDPFNTIEKRLAVILDLHQGVDPASFIDSSNLYIHFIDAVYLLNPSVKCILSVRNGKDFVRSAFSRRWHEKRSFGTVPQRNDPFFDKWESLTPLQKNSWIWVYRNRKAIQGMSVLPEAQKLIVRIEDVGSHETRGLIRDFSGLDLRGEGQPDKKYNANPSFDMPRKEEWTDGMNREFNEIAGEMMRAFGYE